MGYHGTARVTPLSVVPNYAYPAPHILLLPSLSGMVPTFSFKSFVSKRCTFQDPAFYSFSPPSLSSRLARPNIWPEPKPQRRLLEHFSRVNTVKTMPQTYADPARLPATTVTMAAVLLGKHARLMQAIVQPARVPAVASWPVLAT